MKLRRAELGYVIINEPVMFTLKMLDDYLIVQEAM